MKKSLGEHVTEIMTGPIITQETRAQVTVTATPSTKASAFLLKRAMDWTWQDLRDYVITEITERFGVPQRDALKESIIFKAFIERHGIVNAVLIATCAYRIHHGIWRSAPITVTRFTKNNDPYFADVLLAQVNG
jgi:hypothetical protein